MQLCSPTCSSCYSSPLWSHLHLHSKCPLLRKSEPPAQQSSTPRQRSRCTSAETARERERVSLISRMDPLLFNTCVKLWGFSAQLSSTLLDIQCYDCLRKKLLVTNMSRSLWNPPEEQKWITLKHNRSLPGSANLRSLSSETNLLSRTIDLCDTKPLMLLFLLQLNTLWR